MAGSYGHVVADDGQLLIPQAFAEMVENLGDAYGAIEHMYGMIWWLADRLADGQQADAAMLVQAAADFAQSPQGLERSPGTRGTLPPEDS